MLLMALLLLIFSDRDLLPPELLAFFLLIAVIEAAQVFGLFGLAGSRSDTPDYVITPCESFSIKWVFVNLASSLFSRTHVFLIKVSDFFVRAWGISFLLRMLMKDYDYGWRLLALSAAIPIVLLLLRTALQTSVQMGKIRQRPNAFAMLEIFVMLSALIGLTLLKKWVFLELVGWFFLIAFYSAELSTVKSGRLIDVQWHRFGLGTIGVIGLFAGAFYPRMPVGIGGAQLIKVHFDVNAESPIARSLNSEGWLVDEVDSGFYVVPSQADHHAVFIPRQTISAMQFSGDGAPF